jgi:prepilin signal peptidase PulO-like enzyme (type II secretory pathway)
MLGLPSFITPDYIAAFLAAGTSLAQLALRRVGMRSYIPFGPFLVAGAVLTLLVGDGAMSVVR